MGRSLLPSIFNPKSTFYRVSRRGSYLLHDLRRTVWKRIWQADGLRTPSSIIYRDGMYDAWAAVARVLAAFHSLATFQTATPSHLLLEHTFAFVDAGLFVWRITDTRLVRAPRVTVTS